MRGQRRWVAALVLWSGTLHPRLVPWTFRADFRHGFSGWMSYPLPQDIGFDPTLWVEPSPSGPVLIRQVVGAGQSTLSAGFIRPLHFLANTCTRVHLRYRGAWPSAGAGLRLSLAAEDGQKYDVVLPADGNHDVTRTGRDLQLPTAPVAIEAIVLEGSAAQPAAGATNRLELQQLEVDAARPAEVPLLAPALLADPDRARVAARVVDTAEGLLLELGAGASPVRVVLKNDQGRRVVQRALAAPGRYSIPLGADARPGLWTARLQSDDAVSEFLFLVLGAIPARPRVVLGPDRLVQLRSAPSFAPLRRQIHEQARAQSSQLKEAAQAGTEIAALPIGSTLRPSFDGELTTYFQNEESYSNAIASSALDYALTGDTASLESARRNLLAAARWATWTPPRFAAHGMHTYYEAGVFTRRLAFAYDLIADGLSAAERREIADAFWAKSIEPTVEEYFSYDRMPTAASNWMANSLGGALAAAVAVAGDMPGWRNREGVALAQLIAAYEQNLRGLFPGDGSEMEPAGYEHFAIEGLSWGAAALRNLGIRPPGTADMLEAFWWPDYAMVRPDLVLDTGDFNGEFRSLAGFAFGAEFGAIPALRAFYERVDRQGRAPSLLELLCCSRPAQPAGDPPLSRIFAARGSAVFRSGWGPDATVISLRAGPWFNHEHHDQGSFQVAAFGAHLISEAGYANYYLDPNYPVYFTQAAGHNTMLLDGDPFSQSDYDGRFWSALRNHPAFTSQLLSAGFDYLAADLAAAYGGRASAYRRQYLFLRPDVLIIRDDLRSAQPHEFTWLLHAAENAGVEARRNRAIIRAGDAQADLIARGSAAWDLQPAPLPARISQYLGNVLLHAPGDSKTPQRYVLRLSSSRSSEARFEVAIDFRRRSAGENVLDAVETPNASGFSGTDVWALFRSAPGELRFSGLSSDGSVFAGRGVEEWIAIGARSVRQGMYPVFSASTPANAAWRGSSSDIELELRLDAPTTITARASGPVAGVSVNGRAMPYRERNGEVSLNLLSQGEYRVRIAARAAF